MRKAPQVMKQLGMKRWIILTLCVWLSLQAVLPVGAPVAYAENLGANVIDEVEYIAPRLPADAEPYDPEHPENLSEDQLYAKAAILIEATSGDVIFEKNPDQRMYPASTTKILTTLIGIMMGDMSQEVTLSEVSANIPDDSSTIPLKVGESIRFGDLLYATMVRSGNEGANLIAETIGNGSINDFVDLMNQAAAMYGCTNTHFVNPSGLHHDDHYSTPRDMAKIAKAAMENEDFRAIAQTHSYRLPRSNLRGERILVRSDAILNPNLEDNEYYYEYATGIKTGNHSHAGYCFVGSAEKDGVKLISVVFYTTRQARWTDTRKLMEYGFSQFVSMTPMEMYNLSPISIETSGFSMEDKNLGRLTLSIRARENAQSAYIVATRTEMEAMARNLKQIALIDYTRDFNAPITAGEVMGTLTYYPPSGGAAVVYDLVATRSIERRMNAPRSIAEMEAEVYADPNPLPPFSVELLIFALSPFVLLFILFRLLMRLFRKTGRHKKGRVPKPGNRYFR